MSTDATVTMSLTEYEERRLDHEELLEEVEFLRSEVRSIRGDLERLSEEKYSTEPRVDWGILDPDGSIIGYPMEDAQSIVKQNPGLSVVSRGTTPWLAHRD